MRPLRVSDLSLQWKLPLLVGTLLLGLGAALYAVAYFQVRQEAARAVRERLATVAGQIAGLLESQGHTMAVTVVKAADTTPVRAYFTARGDAAGAIRALRVGHENDSTLAAIILRDTTGAILSTFGAQAASLGRLSDAREFPHAARDTGLVGRFRALGDSVYFPMIALLTDLHGPLGYVTYWYRTRNAPSARGPVGQLIGSDAMLLIGSRDGAWMNEGGPTPAPDLQEGGTRDGLYRYQREGNPVLAAVAPVTGTPWSVAIEFPAAVVTAPADRFLRTTAPLGALLVAIGLVLAWLASRQLTRPLSELTLATDALGQGGVARVPAGSGDEVGRLASAFNLMASRLEQEAASRSASEAQWRAVFHGSPHPKWVYEAGTGRILAVNPAAIRDYGYSEAEFLGLDIRALDAPRAEVQDPVDRGTRHRTKDGALLEVEVTEHDLSFNGTPARFVLAQNVTERHALEARFRHAQKMQAVGRLAGGVAHDFNNFLTAIGAYAELARDGLAEDDQRARDLDEILRASAQANRLTRQLLAFTRQQVLQPVVLELDTAVLAMREMLKHLVREDVEVVTRLESQHARTTIDPGHLEQVLMNLVVNARDAMPRGGRVTIRTSLEALDQTSARLHGLEMPGRYVVLSVADTGVGMSNETRARIFEPFFTTKEAGHGTGLGLATVYGIVTQRGGHITAYSEIGVGTTFRVYLPEADAPATPEVPLSHLTAGFRGTETILLVEDEASVRAVAQQVLERQGYTVLAAGDPHEAMALASLHGGSIHLVVSDVVMPHTDGPTLIRRLREEYPRLKALMMSGYAGDALPKIDAVEGEFPFLAKPFTVQAFARKVREVLDS